MADDVTGVRLRLEPRDEYTHPLEAAENFNESMYFNVFDRGHRVGGWFRIGNRLGYGLSEFLDQIVDGEPVGLKAGC
jgi:hypothetical protein